MTLFRLTALSLALACTPAWAQHATHVPTAGIDAPAHSPAGMYTRGDAAGGSAADATLQQGGSNWSFPPHTVDLTGEQGDGGSTPPPSGGGTPPPAPSFPATWAKVFACATATSTTAAQATATLQFKPDGRWGWSAQNGGGMGSGQSDAGEWAPAGTVGADYAIRITALVHYWGNRLNSCQRQDITNTTDSGWLPLSAAVTQKSLARVAAQAGCAADTHDDRVLQISIRRTIDEAVVSSGEAQLCAAASANAASEGGQAHQPEGEN